MSVNKKLVKGSAVSELVEQVQSMSIEDAYNEHGIEIYEDGVVYDSIEDLEYSCLIEWAEAQIAESQPKFEKRRATRYEDE